MLSKIIVRLETAIVATLLALFFSGSSYIPQNENDEFRHFLRNIEFDYFNWTMDAVSTKLYFQTNLPSNHLLLTEKRKIVFDFLELTDRIIYREREISRYFIDPSVLDPISAAIEVKELLLEDYQDQILLAPLAEAILEAQISDILISKGLDTSGSVIPPVSFRTTPLPYHLVISPRNIIQQTTSFSLVPSLTIDMQVNLENRISDIFDVSSLVVPVGGIGSYPTMVERSTSLDWLTETIAHEWIHNWLEFHPLGRAYEVSAELRTMNETAASIAGVEISQSMLIEYYPEHTETNGGDNYYIDSKFSRPDTNDIPVVLFDYRAEMHETRVTVDSLLEGGNILSAEEYMENRRLLFLANGYELRKLNQAFFAFYGAYADVPGGAAGEDPVGPAVRALRDESSSLIDFLNTIANMKSFDELLAKIQQ